jgi:hypothetical protein
VGWCVGWCVVIFVGCPSSMPITMPIIMSWRAVSIMSWWAMCCERVLREHFVEIPLCSTSATHSVSLVLWHTIPAQFIQAFVWSTFIVQEQSKHKDRFVITFCDDVHLQGELMPIDPSLGTCMEMELDRTVVPAFKIHQSEPLASTFCSPLDCVAIVCGERFEVLEP